MEKENISGNIVDLPVLKRLFTFIRPYRGKFFLLIFLTLSLALVAPIRPLLIQQTIDKQIATGDFQGLINMVLLLVGLLVLQAVVQYSHTYMSGWLGQHIIRDMRVQLYKHLLRMRLKFFDNTPIGRLVTRTVSDIETLADVFSQGIAAMMGDLLQLFFILGVMFYIDWELTLVTLATLPFLIFSTYVFKEKIKTAFNNVRNAVSNLNSFVQEHITGMNIVQIFTSEDREYQKFKAINKEHRKANLNSVLYYSIYFPVAEVIQAIGIGLVVWYGAEGVLAEDVSFGDMVAFIMYIQMFFRPIRMIADRFNTVQMGIVSTSRITKLLDNNDFIPDEGDYKPDNLAGEIEFRNVWFAYNDEEYVLKDISFKVKKGQA
ncbi:MAG: ABC transporter transmembrane domain-containing protein, partial [Cyclobacteriaceae bacterium]